MNESHVRIADRALAARLASIVGMPALPGLGSWRRRVGFHLTRLRLLVERWTTQALSSQPRILATACWSFPIYSQTFVYQELEQLSRNGFRLRFLYVEPAGRDQLGGRFARLWRLRRRTWLQADRASTDLAWFRQRMPDRVDEITSMLARETGQSERQLQANPHYRMAFSYARLVKAWRPDYLHTYFFYEATLFAWVSSKLLNIPRGVTCYADHRLDDFSLKAVAAQLRACDLVVATSHQIQTELAALIPGHPPDHIVVKPNANDTNLFPVVNRAEPAHGEPFHLVCVSRFDPKKGLSYLIDALPQLLASGFDVRLHLAGTVDPAVPASLEYERQLAARVEELRLGRHIVFEGRCSQPQIVRLLGQAHVFVAPSIALTSGDSDGIPTALLEAMATGAPVITTDAGSIPEVVTHGRNGIVVPQRHSGALARALTLLLESPELRERLGRAGADTIRAQFDSQLCESILHRRVRHVIRAHEHRR